MERWEESLKRARSAARAAEGQTDATSRKYASEQAKYGSTYAVESAGGKAKAESEPLTVSGAMALAKGALENVTVKLVGEVSEVSNKAGYKAVYFTVKDQKASLPCMMWLNRYRACGVELDVGALVELTGRFTLYAPKGRMNFDVFSVSLAGEGNLRMQVANLARKLYVEGLTDEARKRPVPANIQVVGLVTSPRGDAVHDVLRTLRRRWPLARVLVAGVPVEGARAPQELVRGIDCVSRAGAEAVLLVRGGGSYEDLMPFNDEGLARAIAACPVPVVTGIGHEPDTTIADLVADVRASTPTGAAEAVSPSSAELSGNLVARARAIHDGLIRRLDRSRVAVDRVATRPVFKDSSYLLGTDMQTIDFLSERLVRTEPARIARERDSVDALAARLARALPANTERNRVDLASLTVRMRAAGAGIAQRDEARLETLSGRLASQGKSLVAPFAHEVGLAASRLNDLSPLAVIARGYAIARTDDGAVVKNIGQAPVGSKVAVQVSDGTLSCTVDAAAPATDVASE